MKLKQIGRAYYFQTHSGDNVYIGNPEESEFKPLLWLTRWMNESFLKIPVGKIVKNLEFDETNNYVIWDTDLFTVKVYPKEAEQKTVTINEQQITYTLSSLGGLEFEAILKTKPSTNSLTVQIETQNLKYYYQPPLTEELNVNEYDEVTETYAIKDGQVIVFRPLEVVGSYAVYHATKTPWHKSKEEAEKYKVGKAFHIYRPKLIDVEGKTAWAELSIDEKKGVLTITLPQEFLDEAIYPVTIDPTFGYESVGSAHASISDRISGTVFSCPEEGTAISLTGYVVTTGSHLSVKYAIYKESDSSLVDNTGTVTVSTTPQWLTSNVSGANLDSADYVLVGWGSKYEEYDPFEHQWIRYYVHMYFDSVEEDIGRYETKTFNSFSDPASFSHENRKYSIYCTYTAEGVSYERTLTEALSITDDLAKQVTLPEIARQRKKIVLRLG